MKRVTVIVEGATEERFVTDVLAPELHLASVSVTPIILGVPGHRGGRVNYARVRKDIIKYLKSDPTAYCTTLFDYYGLGAGFPSPPLNLTNSAKATHIEAALKADIVAELDHLRANQRFIPYLQVHEYEALLFSDPNALAAAIRMPKLAAPFTAISKQFQTPEDINDNPQTAPSKRILAHYPSYNKVIDGTIAAQNVSIQSMRRECPHFHTWLLGLESLPDL